MSHAKTSPVNQALAAPHLSDADFRRIADFIARELGIQMPPAKKPMIAARLLRRVRVLGYRDYGAYFDYLHTTEGLASEATLFVDLVTTHTTHFFREPQHFELITQVILPDLRAHQATTEPLRFWSAACSTGEEAYSLAMVLDSQSDGSSGFDFRILATDVSEHALTTAKKAIYSLSAADQIPPDLRSRYLMRSRDSEAALIRIVPTLRAKVRFQTLNFMHSQWPIERKMNLVICRNVLIYFSREQQAQIITKLREHLLPGGYLILSHTESLAGQHPDLHVVGRSVFQLRAPGAHPVTRTVEAATSPQSSARLPHHRGKS